MNVLVVGGAGYIGSSVVIELVKAGHRVVAFDDLSRGHREAVSVPLVVGDIGDAAAMDAVFKKYPTDVVMHFAAFAEVGESMKIPERYFRNNTANTLTLLEAMLKNGVGKIVFSSTAALFGNPDTVPVTDDAPVHPTNPYGESKAQVEHMLDWMNRIHGLRFACLRYFNAAGAADADHGEDHTPESHLIPLILQVALGQRPAISIFGTDYPTPDGSCVRDYVHVTDLAQAHLLSMEALSKRETLRFNLGNGKGFSVREVIEAARKVTGRPIPCIESPRRPGDPATLVASSDKIRQELGWTPRFGKLEDIIRTAWEWHSRHPNGYASQK